METDFTDDRLTIVLSKLSQESTWLKIEGELNTNTTSIYDLRGELVRRVGKVPKLINQWVNQVRSGVMITILLLPNPNLFPVDLGDVADTHR